MMCEEMTCEELRDEYAAYALGIAEDPERAAIAIHLESDCPACSAGVRESMTAVAAIAGAVKPASPPNYLRQRVVAMVAPHAGRSWAAVFLPWGLAAAFAIALVAVALPSLTRQSGTGKLDAALSILNDPATRDVSFGDPAARGRVFVSADKGIVFIAAHLPSHESNKTFELWLIPRKGNPIPAGTFSGTADSSTVYVRPGPVENTVAVAVTIEPAGGSALPTTTPFIVTKL